MNYVTNFKLMKETSENLEDVNEYLDDNLAQYLDDDNYVSIIMRITNKASGVVSIETKEELDEEGIEKLEDFLLAQYLDGIGSGLEQQYDVELDKNYVNIKRLVI